MRAAVPALPLARLAPSQERSDGHGEKSPVPSTGGARLVGAEALRARSGEESGTVRPDTLAVLVCNFVLSSCFTIVFSASLPDIEAAFHLTTSQVGLVFLALGAGAIVGMFVSVGVRDVLTRHLAPPISASAIAVGGAAESAMHERGSLARWAAKSVDRAMLAGSLVCAGVVNLLLFLCPTEKALYPYFLALVFALFCCNSVMGNAETVITNSWGKAAQGSYTFLHGGFGVGAVTVPFVLRSLPTWRQMFLINVAFSLCMSWLSARTDFTLRPFTPILSPRSDATDPSLEPASPHEVVFHTVRATPPASQRSDGDAIIFASDAISPPVSQRHSDSALLVAEGFVHSHENGVSASRENSLSVPAPLSFGRLAAAPASSRSASASAPSPSLEAAAEQQSSAQVSKPIAENSASVSFAPRVIKVVSALPGRSLLRVLVWMPQYWMLVIALCFYVAMEQGVGAWVSTLMEERGFDNVSKLSTSLFWAGQTTGRLTFSWASLRYGLASTNSARIRFAMVHLSVCAASAITLIGFPDPPVALIITFVFGLGCSILFPVIVAFANSILPTATSGDRLKMLTGMLLGASFGAGAFPAVQGAISGAVSVRWSIFCSPVIAALNASLLLILYFRYS